MLTANNQSTIIGGTNNISGYPQTTHVSQWDPYSSGMSLGAGISIDCSQLIRGEMVLIERVFDPSTEILPNREQMKKELVEELVEKLLKSNYVEFTKQDDLKTNLVTYRARAFLTPDDQVRELRKEII